jgi:hypothetical protein
LLLERNKMKKISILFILASFLVLSVGYVSACDYNDHHDCDITKTLVEGKIYFADTNKPAGNADVTVTCTHLEDGKDYVKTIKSSNSKWLKGTYLVQFPQSECVSGDTVVVSAIKSGKAGSEDGIVEDSIEYKIKKCFVDIDLALIDVPLVPEFGYFVGVLTIVGALGVFFVVRKK